MSSETSTTVVHLVDKLKKKRTKPTVSHRKAWIFEFPIMEKNQVSVLLQKLVANGGITKCVGVIGKVSNLKQSSSRLPLAADASLFVFAVEFINSVTATQAIEKMNAIEPEGRFQQAWCLADGGFGAWKEQMKAHRETGTFISLDIQDLSKINTMNALNVDIKSYDVVDRRPLLKRKLAGAKRGRKQKSRKVE